MQVAVQKDQRLVNEVKFDLDGTLIAHHVFKPCRDNVSRYIRHQWTEALLDKYDQVGRLKANGLEHDELGT